MLATYSESSMAMFIFLDPVSQDFYLPSDDPFFSHPLPTSDVFDHRKHVLP